MAQLIDILAVGVRDSSGNWLVNGSADFYLTGTTTRATVYEDNAQENPLPNPATLDGAGSLIAYTTNSLKVVVSDSDGAVVRTYENIQYHRGNIISSEIQNDSITKALINSNVAGDGLGQDSGGALTVRVDNATIEISSDVLQVKDNGIDGDAVDNSGTFTVSTLTGTTITGSTSVVVNGITLDKDGGQFRIGSDEIKINGAAGGAILQSSGNDILNLQNGSTSGALGPVVVSDDTAVTSGYRILSGLKNVTSGQSIDFTDEGFSDFLQAPHIVAMANSSTTYDVSVSTTSASAFTVHHNSGGNLTVFWIAFGRYT